MKKIKSKYIEDFNNKYTTDLTFEEILKDINYQERIDESNKYKTYFQRKTKTLVTRLSLIFCVVLVCLVVLTVGIVRNASYCNQINGIEDILTEEEQDIFYKNGEKCKNDYTKISLEGECNIYIYKTMKYDDTNRNNKVYTYYYKVFFEKDDDKLTIKTTTNEYQITNEEPFGVFETITIEDGKEVTLSFSLEYNNKTKYYQFTE